MFSFSTIDNYHLQLQSKNTSCVDAVEYYISNIEKNKRLNAFAEIFADEALDKAKQLDEKRNLGKPLKKLHGVVIAIKDVICYKEHKISAASNILDGFTSLYTATALQYLLDEDAIVIGSSNCDEFAMGSTNEKSKYGKVHNAIDETKVPGGSSGGSAVAVQADMCMLSLGSDTGGSVRQPADFCGIIGLKPSYGTISRYGLIAYASSFDQIGIFGKTIKDVEILLEIMAKNDKMDSTMLPTEKLPIFNHKNIDDKSPKKFCLLNQVMNHPSLDAEIKNGIESTAEMLKESGQYNFIH